MTAAPESVAFDTLVVERPIRSPATRIRAHLYLPAHASDGPAPAMVLLTSSAGVQRHREGYYAETLAQAGVAALLVDSLGSRGVRSTVADQSLVSAFQMECDAVAALRLLQDDPRIDPVRIGVMGVSKGAVATVNLGLAARDRWRRAAHGPLPTFALHAAICPGGAAQHLDARTLGAPMFLMMGERDDYTPPALALSYAERMRAAGSSRIRCKVYAGAHHGWESVGPVYPIPKAQNFSDCRHWIDDEGLHRCEHAGPPLGEPEFRAWAREHCLRLGAHAGGGTAHLKARATADLLAFLKDGGF